MISMYADPTFSVIIPYHNNGRFLHACVTSALRASLDNSVEVIVVDDGSTEPHRTRYLNEVERLGNVRVVPRPNGGLPAARNTGLAVAQGQFVQFLDADDILIPGKLDLQLRQLSLNPDIDISLTNYFFCDVNGTGLRREADSISRFGCTLEDFAFFWERGFSIPIHCALFRREAIAGVYFDESLRSHEDWVFWCGIAARKKKFAFLDVGDAVYRMHGSNATRSPYVMARTFLDAALKIDSTHRLGTEFFREAMNWFSRHYIKVLNDAEEKPRDATITDEGRIFVAHGETRNEPPLSRRNYNPKVSVVVPVFNHYRHLRQCIRSICSQANHGVELIIIDDASTDRRVKALLREEFEANAGADITLHFNSQNAGIVASYNRAIEMARGEFVAFVDCDDFLEGNAFRRVTEELADHSVDYIYTDRFGGDGNSWSHVRNGGYPHEIITGDFGIDIERGMIASHLKVVRKRLIEALGGFPQEYEGIQDYWLALAAGRLGASFKHLAEPLYYHRSHSGSVTQSAVWAQFRATAKLRRQHLTDCYRAAQDPYALPPRANRITDVVDGDDKAFVLLESDRVDKSTALDLLQNAWRTGSKCFVSISRNTDTAFFDLVAETMGFFDAVFCEDRESYCRAVQYCPFDIPLVVARN